MNPLSNAITVLTAMITPAVLISACGSMILSTSIRLGRVVDRVRALSDRWEEMTGKGNDREVLRERQEVIFDQLDKLTSRARILQRSMVAFYLAVGIFVATSVAIGLVALKSHPRYNLAPIILGLLGACCLFYGSILLIFEARLALSTIHLEMDFIWRQSKRVAPADIIEHQQRGCHNINFVSPTHFAPQMARSILLAAKRGLRLPIVYNTNAYDSVEVLKLLDGVVDVYLPDLKYAEDE